MPHGGTRRPELTCRCPRCGYEVTIEEGQRCERIDCPHCRRKLREV